MKVAGKWREKNVLSHDGKDNVPPKQCHECSMMVYPEPIPHNEPAVTIQTTASASAVE